MSLGSRRSAGPPATVLPASLPAARCSAGAPRCLVVRSESLRTRSCKLGHVRPWLCCIFLRRSSNSGRHQRAGTGCIGCTDGDGTSCTAALAASGLPGERNCLQGTGEAAGGGALAGDWTCTATASTVQSCNGDRSEQSPRPRPRRSPAGLAGLGLQASPASPCKTVLVEGSGASPLRAVSARMRSPSDGWDRDALISAHFRSNLPRSRFHEPAKLFSFSGVDSSRFPGLRTGGKTILREAFLSHYSYATPTLHHRCLHCHNFIGKMNCHAWLNA